MYIKDLFKAYEIIKEFSGGDDDEVDELFDKLADKTVRRVLNEWLGSDGWHIEYVPPDLDSFVVED
ncbi:MAG: hypothetical protein LM575_06915 [Caldimicrobium sp.]|nr:hypothetical protein [Caldimicrobium sp.]